MNKNKRPKIGLALGSGGAKGLSHIGVIKFLEEKNIPISYIAGSSIGALIGGVYAVKKDIEEIENEVLNNNWKKIFSLLDPIFKGGLIGGKKVEKLIEKYTNQKKFNETNIKLKIIATDIDTGNTVIIDRGDIATAIRASISFPLLFKPIKIDGKTLADGGLSMPVPVDVTKKMGADIVIAVNLDGSYFDKASDSKKTKHYNTANNSLNILKYHLANYNIENADIVVTPKTGSVSWGKFLDGKNTINAGEKAMTKKFNDLKKLIDG